MKLKFFLIFAVCFRFTILIAEEDSTETFKYEFKTLIEIPSTIVKDQGKSNMCWVYSTLSFLESEVLRKTNQEVDLSEGFIVRGTYTHKAQRYVKLHGLGNFAHGGQAHDVTNMMKLYGIVPQEIYNDLEMDDEVNHHELERVTKSFLDAVIDSRHLTSKWFEAFSGILDTYLGERPKYFHYDGKKYTPLTFMSDYLKINPNDYIEFTSYSNYPFYEKCCLEVPDNWDNNCDYYNVPIDDLEDIVDQALEKGYSVCWDADISEKYFTPDTLNIAIQPTRAFEDTIEKIWDDEIIGYVKEMFVDQEARQQTIDNYITTDDHLMHIIGIVEDPKGNKYYKVKNSWGYDVENFDGFNYVSKPYFRMKTIALMINKEAVPRKIRKKFK